MAQALEESLNEIQTSNFKFQIELADPFPKIYSSSYKTVGSGFRDFYGRNFHLTNRPEVARAMHTINEVLVNKKLKKIISQVKPDVIATTHALATMETAKALAELRLPSKLAIVIADPFTPHAVWYTFREADLYLSPTREVTSLLIKNRIPLEKIKTTGWLVRKKFRENLMDFEGWRLERVSHQAPASALGGEDVGRERRTAGPFEITKTLRKTLGFDENKFTIFLGGSGQGGGKIYQIAKLIAQSTNDKEHITDNTGQMTNSSHTSSVMGHLSKESSAAGHLSDVNCQVIVVCGMNKQLLGKLMKLAEERPKLFHLYPYVNNMRELLGASDVVVGKAGPNLLFESIFMEKPFLATGCLPGQEEGNLEFIKRENLGWVVEEPKEAVELLEELCNSNPPDVKSGSRPERRDLISPIIPNLIRVRAQHLNGSQNAAAEIARLVQN